MCGVGSNGGRIPLRRRSHDLWHEIIIIAARDEGGAKGGHGCWMGYRSLPLRAISRSSLSLSSFLSTWMTAQSQRAFVRLQQHSRSTSRKRATNPGATSTTARQHLAGRIMLEVWMRTCRNSVLVFVQDPIWRAGSLEIMYSMEHPRLWGGAQAKKGPSEGDFFFLSSSSLSRRRVAEELLADGATASWTAGSLDQLKETGESSRTGRGGRQGDIEAEDRAKAHAFWNTSGAIIKTPRLNTVWR